MMLAKILQNSLITAMKSVAVAVTFVVCGWVGSMWLQGRRICGCGKKVENFLRDECAGLLISGEMT